MAVYTDVSDRQIAEFLAGYDIGDLVFYKGIAEGVENTNYILQTSQGTFILTLFEKRVKVQDLPFFLNLMAFLAAAGVPCPVPVRNRCGEFLAELAGRKAAVVSFLQGVSLLRPTNTACEKVGTALAQLHEAGKRFEMTRANDFSVAGWRRIMLACGSKLNQIRPKLAEEIAAEYAYLEAHWPQNLPRGIIHADLFPDNVFFLEGEITGLIDYYFACTDFFAFDIAICLNAWCFEADNSFNITKSKAFLRGYEKVRNLEPAEIAALPILCRGAALRFLLTRAYDWLNPPQNALVRPKDPLEYRRKLRFHQQAATPANYGFVS